MGAESIHLSYGVGDIDLRIWGWAACVATTRHGEPLGLEKGGYRGPSLGVSWDQDQKVRIRRFPPCPGDNHVFVWMDRHSKAIRHAVHRVIREPVKSDSSHLETATICYTLRRATQVDESLALIIASRPDHRHIFEGIA